MNEGHKLEEKFTCGVKMYIKGYKNDRLDSYRGVEIYIEDNWSGSLSGRFDYPTCGSESSYGNLDEVKIILRKDNVLKVIEILQRYLQMEGEIECA
jgi:hypothetical protein